MIEHVINKIEKNHLVANSEKSYQLEEILKCPKAHFTHATWWCNDDASLLANYTNPGYGLSLVDTLWNAGSYRQPLEQEGNPMT